jgi:hypothetical protein
VSHPQQVLPDVFWKPFVEQMASDGICWYLGRWNQQPLWPRPCVVLTTVLTTVLLQGPVWQQVQAMCQHSTACAQAAQHQLTVQRDGVAGCEDGPQPQEESDWDLQEEDSQSGSSSPSE